MKEVKKKALVGFFGLLIALATNAKIMVRLQNSTNDGKGQIKENVQLPKIKSVNDSYETNYLRPYRYNNVKFLPLQTHDSCLISNIKEVKIGEGLVFVRDYKGGLFVFDKRNGRFINRIGREGSGPEDYVAFDSFFVNWEDRTVTIVDNMRNALLTYRFDGKFQGKKEMPSTIADFSDYAMLVGRNTILMNYFITDLGGQENKAYVLFRKDNGKILDKKSYNPIVASGYADEFSRHPMTRVWNAVGNSQVNFVMPLCDTVFTCDGIGFRPLYTVGRKQKMAPAEKFVLTPRNVINEQMFQYGRQGYFTGFVGLFETDQVILLNYLYQGVVLAGFFADKSKMEGGYFLYSSNGEAIEKMEDIPLFVVTSCDEKSFISVVQPEKLLELNVPANSQSPAVRGLRKVMDGLQKDDNPVLVFYDLNVDLDKK